MLTIARSFLIVAATATLYLGCSEVTGNGTQADMIEVAVDNLSHVGAYYVAFLPDGLNPACEPPDSWIVYSLGEDYVGPSSQKSYLLEKPEGTYCSIFVGRNEYGRRRVLSQKLNGSGSGFLNGGSLRGSFIVAGAVIVRDKRYNRRRSRPMKKYTLMLISSLALGVLFVSCSGKGGGDAGTGNGYTFAMRELWETVRETPISTR